MRWMNAVRTWLSCNARPSAQAALRTEGRTAANTRLANMPGGL
jgi:hypothetical protein